MLSLSSAFGTGIAQPIPQSKTYLQTTENVKRKRKNKVPDTFDAGDEVFQLATEISRYLAQREGAADTFEGLVTWWLFRQRLVEAENKIRLAVQYLCDRGTIRKRTLADGTVLYMAESGASEESNGKIDDS